MILSSDRSYSNVVRITVWLTAVWFFAVVAGVDWFHNHDFLSCGRVCSVSNHHAAHPDCHLSRYSTLLESERSHSHGHNRKCAACQLWSVLSATDFIQPHFVVAATPVAVFSSWEPRKVSATSLILVTGRSPPHNRFSLTS